MFVSKRGKKQRSLRNIGVVNLRLEHAWYKSLQDNALRNIFILKAIALLAFFLLTNLSVAFAPLVSIRVFKHAQVLLARALLATAKRTITSALRVMDLSDEMRFQNYYRVLKRAV